MSKRADSNSLRGRVARYAKTTTAVGGLAVRMAGERYLGVKIDRPKHAADLRLALGGLKGPLMKIAQILALIPDALPQEYVAELAQLQADAPPMGWPFVRRRMTAELGAEWERKFKSFSRDAAFAASLGQVHEAIDRKNRHLACKLQYPDMAAAVEADLKQLALVFAMFERYDKAVSTKAIQQEIAVRLREELDYRREAKHIALYRHMLKAAKGVHVPEIVPELSTGRLLSMTWLAGVRLASLTDAPLIARNTVAVNMFHAWYRPFYGYGVIHGDPHPGNYTFRPDLSLNLLDFGCIRIFPPQIVTGVIELYHALCDKDQARAVEAYESWGFKNPSKKLVEILNIWARFVYAPLLEDRVRPIDETNTGLYGRETASRVHEELRKIGGGLSIPREFVFMDRAAIGLGAVFLRLRAAVNWHQLFHGLIDDFDSKALERRQKQALAKAGLESQTHR